MMRANTLSVEPTPAARLAACWTSLARRGCAIR